MTTTAMIGKVVPVVSMMKPHHLCDSIHTTGVSRANYRGDVKVERFTENLYQIGRRVSCEPVVGEVNAWHYASLFL